MSDGDRAFFVIDIQDIPRRAPETRRRRAADPCRRSRPAVSVTFSMSNDYGIDIVVCLISYLFCGAERQSMVGDGSGSGPQKGRRDFSLTRAMDGDLRTVPIAIEIASAPCANPRLPGIKRSLDVNCASSADRPTALSSVRRRLCPERRRRASAFSDKALVVHGARARRRRRGARRLPRFRQCPPERSLSIRCASGASTGPRHRRSVIRPSSAS